jgi:hypothetical protein
MGISGPPVSKATMGALGSLVAAAIERLPTWSSTESKKKELLAIIDEESDRID